MKKKGLWVVGSHILTERVGGIISQVREYDDQLKMADQIGHTFLILVDCRYATRRATIADVPRVYRNRAVALVHYNTYPNTVSDLITKEGFKAVRELTTVNFENLCRLIDEFFPELKAAK